MDRRNASIITERKEDQSVTAVVFMEKEREISRSHEHKPPEYDQVSMLYVVERRTRKKLLEELATACCSLFISITQGLVITPSAMFGYLDD